MRQAELSPHLTDEETELGPGWPTALLSERHSSPNLIAEFTPRLSSCHLPIYDPTKTGSCVPVPSPTSQPQLGSPGPAPTHSLLVEESNLLFLIILIYQSSSYNHIKPTWLLGISQRPRPQDSPRLHKTPSLSTCTQRRAPKAPSWRTPNFRATRLPTCPDRIQPKSLRSGWWEWGKAARCFRKNHLHPQPKRPFQNPSTLGSSRRPKHRPQRAPPGLRYPSLTPGTQYR